jgi:hypothetical protein
MFAGSVMLGVPTTAFAAPGSNVVVLSQKNDPAYEQHSQDAQDQSYVSQPEDEELRLREGAEQERRRALDCCNPCRPRSPECGENILCGREGGRECQ